MVMSKACFMHEILHLHALFDYLRIMGYLFPGVFLFFGFFFLLPTHVGREKPPQRAQG